MQDIGRVVASYHMFSAKRDVKILQYLINMHMHKTR